MVDVDGDGGEVDVLGLGRLVESCGRRSRGLRGRCYAGQHLILVDDRLDPEQVIEVIAETSTPSGLTA